MRDAAYLVPYKSTCDGRHIIFLYVTVPNITFPNVTIPNICNNPERNKLGEGERD